MKIYSDYRRSILGDGPLTAGQRKVAIDNKPTEVDTPAPSVQNYVERIINLIPGEVVITYPICSGLLTAYGTAGITAATLLAPLLTVFFRTVALRAQTRPQFWAIVISAVAALIWAYQQGGYIIYQIPKDITTVALIVFVVVTAPFVPGEKRIIS